MLGAKHFTKDSSEIKKEVTSPGGQAKSRVHREHWNLVESFESIDLMNNEHILLHNTDTLLHNEDGTVLKKDLTDL